MFLISRATILIFLVRQIVPAFVREAYSLLRQSIIHVEQDDIDIDEDETDNANKVPPRSAAPDGIDNDLDQDVAMSAEVEGTDPTGPSAVTSDHDQTSSTRVAQTSSSSQPSGATLIDTAAPAPPKKRMIITHDQYITLQSMIILRLTQVERETGRGVDRDELIDWYLELKEETMQDIEEIEYHKELITKMLRKLVKVSAN